MEALKTLLKELLLIDSSTQDGANQAVEFCGTWLIEQGCNVSLLENNGCKMLLCEIGEGSETVVFNGHVDVVSGKKSQFLPVEKNGRMYGRGSADMKAGIAAMMFAVSRLKNETLGVKIQLQIVSDEEIGGYNCTGYLVDNGHTGDFAICSEPTQLGIALQAKGVLHMDIEVAGKAAHGSRPWEGENAIANAWELYGEICGLPFLKDHTEFYPAPSVNLAKINGGEVYNKVPDLCTMSLDIRYLPGQKTEQIIRQIDDITNGKLIIKVAGAPVETKKENVYIHKLSSIVEKHTGIPARYFGQHGSADTHFFASKGIPAIEFGPSGANWHGDEEYVEIQSLYTYLTMLEDFARAF
ncbi:M20 family metallopeptidase [Mesobacillus zeae]|uniref:M20 family peptidase n=1 Tax=Mesobacillus zeae TaxID=1917180 RepID=A0A398AXS4_9BACI|nr:M20/M25/M40 family metallo-hydrolase [Mesobacillus zeae]RID82459.1 M20 family peptidase [Mesobacillus zeae]